MKLGEKQQHVLDLIKNNNYSIEELVEKTGFEISVVRNILMEFFDAELVRKSETGIYSMRDKIPAQKNTHDDVNQWSDIQKKYIGTKLKNLSRIV